MGKLIKDCITGIDGETIDPARVLWIIFCLAFIALAFIAVLHDASKFDAQNFGLGGGGLLGGGGIGIGMKSKTEPAA